MGTIQLSQKFKINPLTDVKMTYLPYKLVKLIKITIFKNLNKMITLSFIGYAFFYIMSIPSI